MSCSRTQRSDDGEAGTCWERADLLAVECVLFCHLPKCVLVHIRIKGEVGAMKLV